MSKQAFSGFTDAYEAMIDWPRRLANEESFYREMFASVGARRVLDTACGTGHHAAMFHSWGLAVEGADINPEMIERCRRNFGESPTLRWAVRGFDRPHPEPGSFDIALCAGNSLALAADEAVAGAALRQMLAAVRRGGAVLVHVLNLWRLPDGPVQWQKCVRASLPQGDRLIIKGVHRAGRTGYVNMLVVSLDADGPRMDTETVPFLGLEAIHLEHMLRQAGAASVELFGGYQKQAYDLVQSPDLIAVACR